ncbi:hypothetical protein M422DRAFT_265639 [Sphaerobolus stellatus SS14]|uniref:Uncharacterized protein n=1 Tax=Sphaerobolus stellatus (strain SS14) TaxID=990650 RepID=A0A0C9UTB8_SPHS4|nr:hypothetical protein M422DRAFT_265639 [Sphaerobolus stellatus SS14]
MDTDHDVKSFLTQAAEDFLASSTANAGGKGEVKSESEGLAPRHQLNSLKSGYTPMYEISDDLMVRRLGAILVRGLHLPRSPPIRPAWAFMTSRNANSKLDSPDLVHSSSANRSPESAAETPKGNHVVIDGKQKDALRMEEYANPSWRAEFSGEPAYYEQHAAFKWDGEMPTSETH